MSVKLPGNTYLLLSAIAKVAHYLSKYLPAAPCTPVTAAPLVCRSGERNGTFMAPVAVAFLGGPTESKSVSTETPDMADTRTEYTIYTKLTTLILVHFVVIKIRGVMIRPQQAHAQSVDPLCVEDLTTHCAGQ